MKATPLRISLLILLFSQLTIAQTTGDYRTTGSGTFTSASIWETYNGSAWVPAGAAPSTASNEINIRAPHEVSMSSVTVNQLTVDSGATVNQTGNVFVVNDTGNEITVNGVWNQQGGSLGTNGTNTGIMVVNGVMNWTAGTLEHRNGFVLQIGISGALNFNGSGNIALTGLILENHGSLNWNSGTLQMFQALNGDSCKIINHGLFNWNIAGSTLIGSGTFQIINTTGGTINMNGSGTVTNSAGSYIVNHGLLKINSGTVSINNQNASFHNYGTIESLGSGTFSGIWNVNMYSGSLLKGNGSINANGYWSIHGATTVDSSATLSQLGGYVYGPGPITVHGAYSMSGGEIGGLSYLYNGISYVVISDTGTFNLNGAGYKTLTRVQLTNQGIANWNAGDLHLNTISPDTTKFINEGTFNIGSGTLNLFGQQPARFENRPNGVVNKSTTGTFTTQQGSYFVNQGLINITDGTFSTNNQNASFHNYSTIQCTGNGVFDGHWYVNLYGGSLLTGNGSFKVNGGWANWNIHGLAVVDTSATLSHISGNLYGAGTLTVHGTYTMTGGIIGGGSALSNVVISAFGTLNLNSAVTKTIQRAQVTNHGTANWNAGELHLNTISPDTTKFINEGTFHIGSGTLNLFGQQPARFENSPNGVVNKSTTGTFTTQQGSYFVNQGLINITDGTFSTNNQNASFHNYGNLQASGSGTFNGQWNVNLYTGSLIIGNGSIIANGNWYIAGSAEIGELSTVNQTGGVMCGPGVLTVHGILNINAGEFGATWYAGLSRFEVSPTGQMNLNNNTQFIQSRTKLTNYGTFNWNAGIWYLYNSSGTDTCSFINYGTCNINTPALNWNGHSNTHIRNMSTGLILKSTSTFLTVQSDLTLLNQGTIQGIGTIVLNAIFQSQGTISPGLSPGTLALNGQQPFSANSNLLIELNDASGPGTGHDLLTRNSNITLGGMLTAVETGFVPNGTYTIIQLSAGTVSGSFDTLNIPWYYSVGTTSNTAFLTKNFYYTSSISESICFGSTYDFHGQTLSTGGTYSTTLTSVLGFDSIVVLNLSVDAQIKDSVTVSGCESYIWEGQTYTNSGLYYFTYTAANGCDSTLTLNIFILENSVNDISAIACDSYTNPSGTLTWTSSGTYTETLTNALGCDSVVNYFVTINPSTYGTTQITACNSFTSPSGNFIWTQSGVYTDTITNNVWCDSILTIDLTIDNVNTNLSSDCSGLSAELAGATYQWVSCPNYSPINGATAQSFSPSAAGDYAVIITDGACMDTSLCVSFESVTSGDPFETVNMYPNPTAGAFYLTFPCPVEDVTVAIFNTAGQLMSLRGYNMASVIETHLVLQSGTYIVQLSDKTGKIEYLRLVIL